ncbi:MAG: nitroreductase family protein, partial [Bdellovibrionales bacterium]|nr:nitroreductase family protein [Bdellovibrionales bacterium]
AAKSTDLACENLMLALVAQGLACCPMEGYDEKRIKKVLKLNRHCHVVMGIGIGYEAEQGIYTEQFRIPRELVIKEV